MPTKPNPAQSLNSLDLAPAKPCSFEINWCASHLQAYGLTGQMRLQDWLAQTDFFQLSTLYNKVFFKAE